MAIKKTDGNVVIITALVATEVLDVVAFGTHSVGVAQTAGEIGDLISVDTRGAFEIPAETTEAFVVGDLVSFDTTDKICVSDGTVSCGMVLEGKEVGVDSPILVKIG